MSIQTNSSDEDSSPEFLGIVPPTATLFALNDLAVHPNDLAVHPNDLIPGNTYKVVYDEEMDEGTLLVFHERKLVNQSYRLTRENYCLDEDEQYEPKYNYIFQRKGEEGREGEEERVPIAEVFLHYGLVKFYFVAPV